MHTNVIELPGENIWSFSATLWAELKARPLQKKKTSRFNTLENIGPATGQTDWLILVNDPLNYYNGEGILFYTRR